MRRSTLLASLTLLLALLAGGVARAAFSSTASNAGTSLSTRASFPDYPTEVQGDGPWAYYRGEDAPTSAPTPTVADSATAGTTGRTGSYSGRTDGPVTWWSFDSVSGGHVPDSSGAADTGSTGASATTTTSAHSGSALSLAGTSTSWVRGSSVVLDTARSWSFSLWAWIGPGNSNNNTVFSFGGSSGSSSYLMYQSSSWLWNVSHADDSATGAASNDAYYSDAATTVATQTWTHLAGTYDATTRQMSFYVNGVLQTQYRKTLAASSAYPWTATQPLDVGQMRYNGGWINPWSGYVDEVRLWQRALSSSEVQQEDDPYLARYDFDEASGTTASDSQPSSPADATVTGATLGTSGRSGLGNALVLANASHTSPTQYAQASRSVVASGTSFSVTAWLKPVAGETGWEDAVTQDAGTGSFFWLSFDGTSGTYGTWKFSMNDGAGGFQQTYWSPASDQRGAWHQLTGVYDHEHQVLQLWVDGTLQGTTAKTTDWAPTMGPLQIGRGRNASAYTNAWNGSIDQVRLYSRPLTGPEVAALYSTTGPGTEPQGILDAGAAGVPGALQGAQQGQTARTAVAFGGALEGYYGTQVPSPGPQTFSLECWFKVDNGYSAGGLLGGYTNNATGAASANFDRELYLDTAGKLGFYVYENGAHTVLSAGTYNDGAWHHVVATMGSGGMRIYVGGALVSTPQPVPQTTAEARAGYWRWGLGQTPLGTAPFVGSLDEVAVFPVELTVQQVAWHFHANH